MTTIELKFPANRYHATPWGRHVNEGAVEWPPSPYRLLRALYDAWKRKHGDAPDAAVEELLRALAVEAPRYRLPEATASHTRSYLNSNGLDPTEKSLIFDGFVAMVPGASLYLTWPNVKLTAGQRELLERLVGSLSYVGRSESWVVGRVSEEDASDGIVCAPMAGSEQSGEMIPLACVIPAGEYSEKKPWLEAIAYSTAEFQKDRRSLPPAMRMVPYVRPSDAVKTRVAKAARSHASTQAVLLELRASVLPLVTATVEVAEQVRVRLMGIHRKTMGGDASKVSPMFSGKDRDGTPRKDHGHAFILPLGNARGRIDRVLIYTRSEEGFGPEEVQSILRLTELYGRSAEDPIRVLATSKGKADDAKLRPATRKVVSATPFIPGRHWRKGRGTYDEFLAGDVMRECRNHGLPEPVSVEPAKPTGLFEWVEFRRNRKDEEPRPGYGFWLEFAEPVAAPFSLGYGCHFGLGQFAAAE